MLKIRLVLGLLIATAFTSSASDYLDYHYLLDAVVLERNIDGTTELHFQAVQHPKWKRHSNDELLEQVNHLCGEDVHALKFDGWSVKATLPAVEITEPMNERQLVEMLLARAGLLHFNMQKDPYSTDMHFYSIQFPDQRYPIFNLEYNHVQRSAGQKMPSEQKKWMAIQWAGAKQLLLADYGSDKLLKCVKDRVKAESFKWEERMSEEWVDAWLKDLDCTVQVAFVNPKELFILPETLQAKATQGTEKSEIMIAIPTACFLGDPPCVN
ncbi:MAG: hypothetical protein RLP15_02890 [Cryomorphaceae bacterium]